MYLSYGLASYKVQEFAEFDVVWNPALGRNEFVSKGQGYFGRTDKDELWFKSEVLHADSSYEVGDRSLIPAPNVWQLGGTPNTNFVVTDLGETWDKKQNTHHSWTLTPGSFKDGGGILEVYWTTFVSHQGRYKWIPEKIEVSITISPERSARLIESIVTYPLQQLVGLQYARGFSFGFRQLLYAYNTVETITIEFNCVWPRINNGWYYFFLLDCTFNRPKLSYIPSSEPVRREHWPSRVVGEDPSFSEEESPPSSDWELLNAFPTRQTE